MKKIIVYSLGIVSLASVGLLSIPIFAQAKSQNSNSNISKGAYGYQQNIQSKAEILGITEDDLKSQLETKSLFQIAEEKNVSEDQLHDAMQKNAQERWASKGLTQAEIDSKLQDMKERQAVDHEGNYTNGGMRHNRYNQ